MTQGTLAILLPGNEGWTANARPGLWSRPLYADADAGLFFGWIRFDAMATTGMHQHLGPAFSYIVEGALNDFQGAVETGQMGINLSPATHEAIAYRPTLFVARLEAPVLYLEDAAAGDAALHTGARTGAITVQRPEDLPDLNITVADLPMVPTSIAGVGRRMIFDYRGTSTNRRCVQLQMLPGMRLPRFHTVDRLDLFMLGGSAQAGDSLLPTGCLASFAPGSDVSITSRFGALIILWSDGPVEVEGSALDPLGF